MPDQGAEVFVELLRGNSTEAATAPAPKEQHQVSPDTARARLAKLTSQVKLQSYLIALLLVLNGVLGCFALSSAWTAGTARTPAVIDNLSTLIEQRVAEQMDKQERRRRLDTRDTESFSFAYIPKPARNGTTAATASAGATKRLLWDNSDDDVVPHGFAGCDTTAMPPEFAPVRAAGNTFYFSGISGYDVPCQSVVPGVDAQIEKVRQRWVSQRCPP